MPKVIKQFYEDNYYNNISTVLDLFFFRDFMEQTTTNNSDRLSRYRLIYFCY